MSQDIEPDHVHDTENTHGHSHSDISSISERRNITISVNDSSNFPNRSHKSEAPSLDKEVFVLLLLNLFLRNLFGII